MTFRHIAIVLFLIGTCSTASLGSYVSILVDLVDATQDFTFDVSSGGLEIFSDTSDAVTLNDSITLPGTVTNTILEFGATLDQLIVDPELTHPIAVFRDAEFLLTFDYDDGNGPLPYFIGGPIGTIDFLVTSTGPVSGIGAAGVFDVSWNLPGSNDWPSPQGDINVLGLVFEDLSDWAWDEDLQGQNKIRLTPTVIPESSVLVPMFVFLVIFLRRTGRGA